MIYIVAAVLAFWAVFTMLGFIVWGIIDALLTIRRHYSRRP